jgi:hypothetical protein
VEGNLMAWKRRFIYILLFLAVLLGVAAYASFVYLPVQDKERPTLVYFYAGG